MATDKDNITFEKTSFLEGGNSPFIEDLYLQYLKNPKSIPQSWIDFLKKLCNGNEKQQKSGSL